MDGMSPAPVPGELGAFLKARRAQLSPRDVGLPETGTRRKVAGLRREEAAQLAAISVDYYTRLEQGRVQASASALATLARALRLDEDQQAYLYEIAGKTDARPRRRRGAQRARPAMRRLLDQLAQTPGLPAGGLLPDRRRSAAIRGRCASSAITSPRRAITGRLSASPGSGRIPCRCALSGTRPVTWTITRATLTGGR
jgi:transcriptional regulator with XRE-family HTH domain